MKSLIALVTLAGCQVPEETPAIPWLHGLSHAVGSDRQSDDVARRIDSWSGFSDVDPECSTGAYPGIEITADVASAAGDETILVSLAHGIVVVDREQQLVTESPGYHCSGGSIDELEAVAAGDAYGVPTIAIAATSGGRREAATWISLFRIGEDRRLDAAFTGVVELRHGTEVERGAVYLLPNALIYRHPASAPAIWTYNPIARAYLRPGDPVDDSHDDGPAMVSVIGHDR
jgi:hypothetical protein